MKIKPILPSLREKKRYLAFEIISQAPVSFTSANNAIYDNCFSYIGELGMSRAGVLILNDKYKNNKGIIRVNHKNVDNLKSSLMIIKDINKQDVIVRTLGVSGILKKANEKFIGG